MVDSNGTWAYTYDNIGRVLTETMPGGYTLTHTYDGTGRKSTELRLNGTLLYRQQYDYDGKGRLTNQYYVNGSSPYNYGVAFDYDANDNLTLRTVYDEFDFSKYQTYTYNAANLVTEIKYYSQAQSNPKTLITGETYSYNLNSTLAGKYNTISNAPYTNYTYNGLGQLTGEEYYADYSGWQWEGTSYTFDDYGNRLSNTVIVFRRGLCYNASDEKRCKTGRGSG